MKRDCYSTLLQIAAGLVVCLCFTLSCEYPGAVHGEGSIDDSDDPPDEVYICGDPYARITVSGEAASRGVVWAGLEREGELLATSQAVPVAPGSYSGFYLLIPLSGLQLDTNAYDISIYVSDNETALGNRTRTRYRELEAARAEFSQSLLSAAAQRPLLAAQPLVEHGFCLFVGDTLRCTVTRDSFDNLMIIPGLDTTTFTTWDIGGNNRFALQYIKPGVFTARLVADVHNDAIVIVEDWGTGERDSVGVTILPKTPSYVLCDKTNSQVGTQTPPTSNRIVSGAKAKIKCRYGQLCGDPKDTTVTPESLVFAGVLDTTVRSHGTITWAQAGYAFIRYHHKGIPVIHRVRVGEVMGSGPEPLQRIDLADTSAVPLEGSVHEFSVRLNSYLGLWGGYYDGAGFFSSISDTIWMDSGGTSGNWMAEVVHTASDMAGTYDDPCFITACSLLTTASTEWQHVDLNQARTWTDNPSEWDWYLTNDTLYIWDWDTLP